MRGAVFCGLNDLHSNDASAGFACSSPGASTNCDAEQDGGGAIHGDSGDARLSGGDAAYLSVPGDGDDAGVGASPPARVRLHAPGQQARAFADGNRSVKISARALRRAGRDDSAHRFDPQQVISARALGIFHAEIIASRLQLDAELRIVANLGARAQIRIVDGTIESAVSFNRRQRDFVFAAPCLQKVVIPEILAGLRERVSIEGVVAPGGEKTANLAGFQRLRGFKAITCALPAPGGRKSRAGGRCITSLAVSLTPHGRIVIIVIICN